MVPACQSLDRRVVMFDDGRAVANAGRWFAGKFAAAREGEANEDREGMGLFVGGVGSEV